MVLKCKHKKDARYFAFYHLLASLVGVLNGVREVKVDDVVVVVRHVRLPAFFAKLGVATLKGVEDAITFEIGSDRSVGEGSS